MKYLIIACILFYSFTVGAQVNRYFVYFKHKGPSEYSLNSPSEYLTRRAIERRETQSIVIDSTDLPVNREYIYRLKEADIDVFFSSRWMNGVLIQTSPTKISMINSLPFVDSVALLAEGSRLSMESQEVEIPDTFDPPSLVDKAAQSTDFQLYMLGANQMHADGYTGKEKVIAILDNGFKGANKYEPFRHLWEKDRIVGMKDFASNTGNVFQFGTHGTQVLSIISGKYIKDSINFSGVAPESMVVLCVTEASKENRIEEYNWLLGAEFADSLGADIINSSLGYTTFDIPEHNYSYEDLDGKSTIVTQAARMAASKGILVVNSAGNHGTQNWKYVSAPADADGILSVGSVNMDFSKTDFSSFGPTSDGRLKPDVAAFGAGTVAVNGSGVFTNVGGTSFSAPLISGFAAGIWEMNPEWDKDELMEAIKNSGHQASGPDNELGYGVPNYGYIAYGRVVNVSQVFEDKFLVYPNPFNGDTLFLKIDRSFRTNLVVKIIDPKGATVYAKEFKKREIKDDLELHLQPAVPGIYYLFLQSGEDQKVVKLINF